MTNTAKIAADALEAKALELHEERVKVRRRLFEDAIRDQQIERDIAGCVAGAAALSFEIDVPSIMPKQLTTVWQNANVGFINARNTLANSYKQLKSDYGIDDSGDVEDESGVEADPRPDMPRIADIIVDRLKIAGEDGSKAASIRRYILNTYNADIHEKTVGMTLYRLQKDGLVRRDGHTWFLGSANAETENTGAATRGPDKLLT